VSLGVAIALGAAADSDFSDYRALPSSQQQVGAKLQQKISDKATAANVMYGVAGALLAASVVLFFVERDAGGGDRTARGSPPRPRYSVAPAAGTFWGMRAHVAY
jgi:hypothetical protein